jgi:hypothetical protein
VCLIGVIAEGQPKAKATIYELSNPSIGISSYILPSGSTTMPDSLIWFDGSHSSTSGGHKLQYAWSILTRPSGTDAAIFVSPGSEVTTINGLGLGLYVFKLTVSDTNDNKNDFEYIPITVRNPMTSDTATIQFVGNGNISASLSSGNPIPANTGIGVIYRESLPEMYKWLYSMELQVSINIASTVDTVTAKYDPKTGNSTNKSDFGNSLLLPINSGQAFSINFRGYLTKFNKYRGRILDNNGYPIPAFDFISGFFVNAVGSNRNWSNDTMSVKASQMSLQIGLFHEFVKPAYRTNYSITLGVGFSGRWLAGDITQHDYDELRQQMTGTTRKSFAGIEAIVGLRLKDIKAEFHIPFLPSKNGMPGLSGTQPSTLIGFTGGFSLQL